MSSSPNDRPPVRRSPRGDDGFTIVEVMVAATLFIVGALATLALLDSGAKATSSSVQRDRANAAAAEVIERTSGLRYTLQNNDLTDVAGTVGPGARLAATMSDSTTPAVTVSGVPGHQVSRWTINRGGTDFDVSYASCTQSERVSQVVIGGPYDCDLPDHKDPDPPPPNPPCAVQVVNRSELDSQFAAKTPQSDVTIRLQLLNTLGAQLCLQGATNALGIGKVLAPACSALGSGASAINTVNGLLGGVFKSASGLGAKIALSVCPRADGTPFDPDNAAASIGVTTKVEVTVSWFAVGKPQTAANRRTIVQSTVVRRPGA